MNNGIIKFITPEKNVKNPEVAGYFYSNNPSALEAQLSSYFTDANVNYSAEDVFALISPHAGYKYSGLTAMYGYKKLYYSLSLSDINNYNIIIIAPAHKVYFKGISTLSYSSYQTPLGVTKIDNRKLEKYINDSAFKEEHSIEVQIPFLQYIFKKANKDFTITPVLLGNIKISETLKIIQPLITDNTIIIVSSDLSHFNEDKVAREIDKTSINNILSGKTEIDACGVQGIILLNQLLAKDNTIKKELLNYSNSGDVTRDKESVVGYASISYYYPQKENILISLARKSIYDELNGTKTNLEEIKNILPKEYLEKKGVFVTLTINNKLRGCIGNIIGVSQVYQGVINNAKNAAFSDPRFKELTKEEFKKTDIEVSILSIPVSCSLSEIKTNDGVILEKDYRSALYLPQVWEQLPNKDDFLGSLCEKARLAWDCYKDEKTNFKKFNVEIIK